MNLVKLAILAGAAWLVWTQLAQYVPAARRTEPYAQQPRQPSQQSDDAGDFYRRVLGNINRELTDMLGSQYRPPVLVLFAGQTHTGHGIASARQGPMYAPDDGKIYVPVSLAQEVRRVGGCSGNPCQAVIAAAVGHEIGHRVQHLLGLTRGGGSAQELQADCLSGAVLSHENKRMNGSFVEPGDLEAISRWQHAIGDDTFGGGQVPPEQAHGTGAQRQQAFNTGWRGGTLTACTGRFEFAS